MNASEEWRPVVDFVGLYEVSSLGRVRSLPRWKAPGGIRIPHVDRLGYHNYDLYAGGQREKRKAHRLVAEAFLGPRMTGQVIRHLDGNPGNNTVQNLVYGTQSENLLDAVRHGRNVQAAQTHCKYGHEFTTENTYLIPPERRRRECRTCSNARKLAHWRANRAVA